MPVMSLTVMSESEVRAAVAREMPGVRADLERLVRIPGIAFDGLRLHSHVERSRRGGRRAAARRGLPDVRDRPRRAVSPR